MSVPAGSLTRLVISVEALDRSVTFYSGVAGLSVHRVDAGFGYLSAGNGVHILLHERPAAPSAAAVAATFDVPDLAAAVAAVEPLGGAVVKAPEAQPWGEVMAVVTDPDGHIVCLTASAS